MKFTDTQDIIVHKNGDWSLRLDSHSVFLPNLVWGKEDPNPNATYSVNEIISNNSDRADISDNLDHSDDAIDRDTTIEKELQRRLDLARKQLYQGLESSSDN